MTSAPHGILPAILTPVDPRGGPDAARLIAHARHLLAHGADGLNVLGTTGQFASFSVDERLAVMEAVAAAGLPVGASLVGTGAAALADAVRLTRRAVELGYGGALVIPPFYYKDVDDEGVFRAYAALIDRVGPFPLYLYHFPRQSGVPITRALVARLRAAYPGAVRGIKDSMGDADLLDALAREAPEIARFPASEALLVEAARRGDAGCISATANVTAPLAAEVWRLAREPDGDEDALARAQRRLAGQRAAIGAAPLIPAIHRLVADERGDEAYAAVAPPLSPLDAERTAALRARFVAPAVV